MLDPTNLYSMHFNSPEENSSTSNIILKHILYQTSLRAVVSYLISFASQGKGKFA